MANIFQEIAADLVKGEALFGKIAAAVELKFEEGVKLAPQTAADLVEIVGDVENLGTLGAGAVGSSGINFDADSAAYAAFEKLLTDLKTLGSNLKADVAALKGQVSEGTKA
jgi:hypothetical protein